MSTQTSILIIYTGGTIGMFQEKKNGPLQLLNFDNIYDQLPILKQFECDIDTYAFDPVIDSSNMNPDFWIRIAEVIEQRYEHYDGFVVLHGTDTMAFTASALSFLLEHLNKPVVFTGSQLPLGIIRTDGRENLITAIEIAAAREDDTPIVPEVSLYFENKLYRGNRTTKFNAENFDAFLSGNYPVLAEAGIHITYHRHEILKPRFKRLKVHKQIDPHIAILKLFPGITNAVVNGMLNIQGLKAVILETYGTGNAPTDAWFLDALAQASQRGVMLYNVTQCASGSVEMGRYETSAELSKIGVISGYDMTIEAAVTKLMYLSGRYDSREQIERLFQTPLRGEMTVR